MSSNKSVDIRYHISEQAVYHVPQKSVDPADMRGGLQILIKGNKLNSFINENNIEYIQDWYPEYVGCLIEPDFIELMNITADIARGNVGIYESVRLTFRSTIVYLLLEPVASQQLRVAIRTRPQRSDSVDQLLVVPESARGYVVDRCTFCQAVSDAGNQYLDEINSMNLLGNEVLVEDFEDAVTELDEAIENCEQTPPEVKSLDE